MKHVKYCDMGNMISFGLYFPSGILQFVLVATGSHPEVAAGAHGNAVLRRIPVFYLANMLM